MGKILQTLKEAVRLLVRDIRELRWVILCVFAYWLATRLIFHHFCPMVIATGFPCPGCGMTRALFSLLTLQFEEAWQYNPSIYVWAVWGFWAAWRRYIRQEKRFRQTGVLAAVFAVTVACYVWRLCTVFPSEPPMAYEEKNLLAGILPFYKDMINFLD